MIRGLGCDLCAVSRMNEIIKNQRFLERYFTAAERAYISGRVRSAETAAGIFAAKEALLKALGTGLGGVDFEAVEIIHTPLGAPEYAMNEKLLKALHKAGAQRVFLSISHDGDYAMATAVLEGD